MMINANNVVLIEGFDMVGKNTFVSKCLPKYFKFYEFDHKLTDETIGRNSSWTAGYSITSFLDYILQNSDIINLNVAINRGVMSSYVYEKLYNNHYLDNKILNWYKNNSFFTEEISHIYIRHHNAETAKIIYESSQSRDKIVDNELNKKYDSFNSFDDYWMMYSLADKLFMDVYKYLGIKPEIYETMPDHTWKRIDEE